MTTKKMHSTANDMKEGQLLFQLLEGTTVIYNIAGLKAPDGKIIPIVDDTRLTTRRWEYKGADYLQNFVAAENGGFPVAFQALCVATGTNAVMNPAGTGAVLVVKANITSTLGDSTITTDTAVTAFGGGSTDPGTNPGTETEAEKKARLAAEEKVRLAGLEDDPKTDTGLSTGAWVGIGLAVVAVIGAIWAFVTRPWKKD